MVLVVFVTIGLFISSASAASNSTINFQGKIVDVTDGTNVDSTGTSCLVSGASNDTCDFRVRIYDAPSAGTLLFEETHSNIEVENTNGVFNLSLNSVCNDWAGGCAGSGITWGSDPTIYIQIEFDPNGNGDFAEGEVFSRKLLQSVPYAYYADTAGSLAGIGATGFVQLQPTSAQTATSSNPLIWLNETGGSTPNLLQLQTGGTDQFVVSNSGDVQGLGHVAFGADSAVNDANLLGFGSSVVNLLSIQEEITQDLTGLEFLFGITNHILLNPSGSDATTYIAGSSNLIYTDVANSQDFDLIIGTESLVGHQGSGDVTKIVGLTASASNGASALNLVNEITGAEFQANNSNPGDANSITGLSINSANSSSEDVPFIDGVKIVAGNYGTGTNQSLTGLSILGHSAFGNVTYAIGLEISGALASGGGTIGDNYGIKIDDLSAGTNDYGLYIQDADTYAIWSDAGVNRFDGNILAGTTTNTAFLNIAPSNASKASLRLLSSTGTNPSAPNEGDLWWNGTNLNFRTASSTVDLLSAGSCSTCVQLQPGSAQAAAGSTSLIWLNDTGSATYAIELESAGVDQLTVTNDGFLRLTGDIEIADGQAIYFNTGTWTKSIYSATNGLFIDSGQDIILTPDETVGIGLTAINAAGARLDIAAATTALSQINLTTSAGVNKTTPVSGDLWWNGTNLNFYDGSSVVDLLASGGGLFTDSGSVTYLTSTSDDFAIGGTGLASPFSVAVSTNIVRIGDGTNDSNNPTLVFYASDASSSSSISVLDGGTFSFTNDLLPSVDDTYDLGSSSNRWQDLYLGPASLHIGTNGDEGVLSYNTTTNSFVFDKLITTTNSTTSNAQIQFGTGGTNPTTPSDGDLWYNGTNLFFYDGSEYIDVLTGGGANDFWTQNGVNVYYDLGNVGIGTADPNGPLQVGVTLQYEKQLTINNPGGVLSNHDVLHVIDTATLVSGGKMQSDCGDIRYTDSDRASFLVYWIESGCNTTATQVWIRVPSIPNGDKTIYFHYGNGSLPNATLSWSDNYIVPFESTCPSGWSSVSAINDSNRFTIGSTAYGTTGGSATHQHVVSGTTGGPSGSTNVAANGSTSFASSSHTHSFNVNSTAGDSLPPYVDVVFCKYDATGIPNTVVSTSYLGFFETTPSGWTRDASFDLTYLRANTTPGGTGTGVHNHTFSGNTGSASGGGNDSLGNSTGSSQGHTHSLGTRTLSDVTNAPPYLDLIFANPDNTSTTLPVGTIGIIDSATLPPLGWTRYSTLDSRYPRGNSASGGTGGSTQHNHTYSGFTTGSGGGTTHGGGFGGSTIQSHTHNKSAGSSQNTNVEPPYIEVVYIEKNDDGVTVSEASESNSTLVNEFVTVTSEGGLGIGTSNTDASFEIFDLVLETGDNMFRISTNDVGASDEYFAYYQTDIDSVADTEFIFRTNGTALADGSFTGGGADIAELYHVNGSSEPGDLVSIETLPVANPGKTLKKSEGITYDSKVIGVISTNPGLIAGGGDIDQYVTLDPRQPVALKGRVPVKVSLENGNIQVGDKLTSSSISGVAMKATDAGKIIGYALESYDGTQQISEGVSDVEQERLELSNNFQPIPVPPVGVGKIMLFVDTFEESGILPTCSDGQSIQWLINSWVCYEDGTNGFLYDTNRQDNVTNSIVGDQVVRKGWGYIQGNDTTSIQETVDFGITFNDLPIVQISSAGFKSGSEPTSLGECVQKEAPQYSTASITNTEFSAIGSSDNFSSTEYYCYTWIAIGSFSEGYGADLAENYITRDMELKLGDVVSFDENNDISIRKSNGKTDSLAFGIVSTVPAEVLGNEFGESGDKATEASILEKGNNKELIDAGEAKVVSVALEGRVPVKVSLENGPIKIGDYLSPASKSGYAMKSDGTGPIIGRALESFDGTSTLVQSDSDEYAELIDSANLTNDEIANIESSFNDEGGQIMVLVERGPAYNLQSNIFSDDNIIPLVLSVVAITGLVFYSFGNSNIRKKIRDLEKRITSLNV